MTLPDSRPLNRDGEGIALLSMPLADVTYPSIALGLLKAILLDRGIPCDDLYLNLRFHAGLGHATAAAIQRLDYSWVGDYLFAGEINGRSNPREYFEVLSRLAVGRQLAESLEEVSEIALRVRREIVPRFLEEVVRDCDWNRYEMVALTSSFHQHTASLALAKRLRRSHPRVPVILGGANAFDDMGRAWLEHFADVDYVCTGEGDTAFPELIERLRAGGAADAVPNMACRRGGEVRCGPDAPAQVSLDALPYPIYDSYFAEIDHLGLEQELRMPLTIVPIETSRGCWWGQKSHCVFCGLNRRAMKFRSKTPRRAYEEIKALSARYLAVDFRMVDNILDLEYLTTLFRDLAGDRSDLKLAFEVKSNLGLAQLRTLKRAGVTAIQPGIESLSTDVLRLMRKGVTALQNVFLLKWARYLGIKVGWNLLYGLPGETAAHYRQQMEWARLIPHLEPPGGPHRIVLQRFSPLFDHPEEYGIENARPAALYRTIYPDADLDLARVAYYFDYELSHPVAPGLGEELLASVKAWTSAYAGHASLRYHWSPAGFLVVRDHRSDSEVARYHYRTPVAEIYELAGLKISTPAGVRRTLERCHSIRLPTDFVRQALERFVDRGLALREGDRFLTLALPAGRRFLEACPEEQSTGRDATPPAEAKRIGAGELRRSAQVA